ncbi:MAG: L,D-transpeptidase family protein [Pseudomonadota bacterium]
MRKIVASLVLSTACVLLPGNAFSGPKDPLQIMVSLSDQSVKVFRGQQQIAASNVSSGKKGHRTPTGIFSVLQKNRHHRSNIYSGAPMPYMQRLTWSGIALHASNNVPRSPASHGCVRLPHKFASQLFKMATNGIHVIIEDNPQLPRRIAHKNLFQPKVTWQTSDKLDRWVNAHIAMQNLGFVTSDQRYPARIFITRRTHKDELVDVQRLLNKLGFDAGDVDGIMGPATWQAISAFRKAHDMPAGGKIDNELIEMLFSKSGERRPANGR